tara:strand:- start:1707 stop:2258 length:552 start_codon:yes stop_codon:yes gene_type:complete
MVDAVIVEKTGELKQTKFTLEEELYKKCKFRKNEDFSLRNTWDSKNSKFPFSSVSLYSKNKGKANTENKYDFPPPVDNELYFGSCILVAKNETGEFIDLTIEAWESFYEFLFGGFENLDSTALEDENEEDELDQIPSDMKTKTGYLKDDFVVEDDEVVIEGDYSSEEEMSELEFEEYVYSDED